jgi:hypothetical protein
MKRLLVILFLTALISEFSMGQEPMKPAFTRKAAYFDKSPPLRDMTVVMPGERKRAWKDGIIKNPSVDMEFEREFPEATGSYEKIQSQKGSVKSRGPLVNFEGIPNVNGVYPPDTDGDVGPDHYFQMINLSFAIWDKNGNKIYGPVDNSTLWSGFVGPWTGTNDGDPIVLYDEDADRWIASQFAIELSNGKSYELVALSVTGDPLGEYYRYAFEFDDFNDYPKLGVWRDGYYCTFNFFSGGFIGGGVAAFERDKMLEGDPDANMVFFGYFPNKYSLQPSDFDGPLPPEGSPNYIATVNTFSNQQFEIYEFDVDWENPSNSTYQLAVSIDPGFFNPDLNGIPQPGTSNTLATLSQMLMYRLAYRNFGTYESMVANHTVNVGANRAGIKWYEFRKQGTDDWEIYQQGVYAPNDGLHRWMGSIAINAQGTIALGYSVSSSSHSPSIRYTGRPANAPLGEMTYDEIEAVTGTGNQSSINRWGDYANLDVDPVDDTTFWFTTEYTNNAWKTRVFAFDFSPLQPPAVYAGEDGMVCQDTVFVAEGEVSFAKSHSWETSGDGILPNPQNLRVVYFRGPQDLQNGGFWLKLTVNGYEPGVQVTDSIYVAITRTPEVFAGNDTVIHAASVYQANAQAENFAGLLWETSGDGLFDDSGSLQAIYTPGVQDIADGAVELTLFAAPNEPCSFGEDDDFTITLDPTLSIGDFISSSNFEIKPNPSSGVFTVSMDKMAENETLNIINTAGEEIFSEKISTDKYHRKFDFRYQPKGIYMVRISSGQETHSKKIVIQ